MDAPAQHARGGTHVSGNRRAPRLRGYVWARRESRLPVFTVAEWVVAGVVALTSVTAVAMIATGNLSVL